MSFRRLSPFIVALFCLCFAFTAAAQEGELTPEVTAEVVIEPPLPIVTEAPLPTETLVTPEATLPVEVTEVPVTPEATPEALPTETQSPFPPEPALVPVFSESFDGESIATELALGAGWLVVNTETGKAVQSGESAGAVLYTPVSFAEGAVQARFLLNSGEGLVILRQSDPANDYSAGLTRDGAVALYRSGVPLQIVTLPLDASAWHTLRLSAFGGVLRVSVDGLEVIALEDSVPLPAGTAGFSLAPGSILRVDDLQLAAPEGTFVIPPPVEAAPELTPEATAEATPEVGAAGDVEAMIACAPQNQIMMVTSSSGAQPSRSSGGYYGFYGQQSIDISGNGRYVAFSTEADNLVVGDTNGYSDVFVFDRSNCSTIRVSVSASGNQLDAWSEYPTISDDGRFVVFQSYADIAASDNNGEMDVYLYDRDDDGDGIFDEAGETEISLVSANNSQNVGDGASYMARISGNGRYVAFYSRASNLAAGDNNNFCDYNVWDEIPVSENCADIYLRDLQTQTTQRVSLTSTGDQPNFSADYPGYTPGRPAVSNDGRYVAFTSYATNMVPGDTVAVCDNAYDGTADENCADVFVRDMVSSTTSLVSQGGFGFGNRGTREQTDVQISANGQYVLFLSFSTNLVLEDFNNNTDAFLRDIVNNTTTRASVSDGGGPINGSVDTADMSSDGNFIVFGAWPWQGNYSPPAPDGVQGKWHIYVHRRDTNQTLLVSKSAGGSAGNQDAYAPFISADGQRVIFTSASTNLVAGDVYAGCETDYVDPYDYNENCPDLFVAPVVFPPPFLVPTNLSVTGFTQTSISLSWTDNNSDESGFRIERSTNGYDWVQIAQVGANVTTYTDNTLLCGTTFMYRVRTYKGTTVSGYSVGTMETTSPCVPQACDANAIITRASTGPNGVPQGSNNSYTYSPSRSLSADGRYVVFSSDARNLLPEDINGAGDVFRFDRQTCNLILVSLADNEALGNGYSSDASVSADGDVVVFTSSANNLVAGDTNGVTDIFVRFISAGVTKRVSVDGATQANGQSYSAIISPDGGFVTFHTLATNLGSLDDNNFYCEQDYYQPYDYNEQCYDVFVYYLTSDTLQPVSMASNGIETPNNYSNANDILQINGNVFVLFTSPADDIVPGDTNGYLDVFLRNAATGEVYLVSRNTAGAQGNGYSGGARLSTDGTNLYVVFYSSANNLVAGDTNGKDDIFLRTIPLTNINSGTTVRVSLATGAAGAQANNSSYAPSVSDNGRYVVFQSVATNLVAGDTNAVNDIFLRDMQTNTTTRISVSATKVQANGVSDGGYISGNGLYIAFSSTASNLVAGDTHNFCESDWIWPYDYNDNCRDVFVAQTPGTGLDAPKSLTATALSQTAIRLNWVDGGPNETAYEIQVSSDGSNWDTTDSVPANTLTYNVAGLLPCGSTWHFRVRSYDAGLNRYSAYAGPISKATMACPTVTAPVLTTPATGAAFKTLPTLTWNNVTNAVSYEVQIANSAAFTTIVQSATDVQDAEFTVTGLSEGTYHWRVRAYNPAVPSVPGAWSAVRTFIYDTTPLTVIANLTAPADQAKISAARPTFSWAAVAGATQYRLQIDDVNDFAAPVVNLIVPSTSYTIPVGNLPLTQGVLYWRVLAMDPAGNEGTNWSAARVFTLFLGTAPADGVFSALTPTFTWAGVAGTTSFQFQLDDDTDFSSDLLLDQAVTGVSYKPAALNPGTYYWRVIRTGEVPTYNLYRTLFIGAAPAAPALVSPSTGALINASMNPPTLDWNPVTPPAGVIVSNYVVSLANNAAFTGAVTYNTSNTELTIPAQTDGLKYWKVQALFVGGGIGTASASRTFTVDTVAPNPPNLTAPADLAFVSTARPTLTWVASPTANRYLVDLAADHLFSVNLLTDHLASSASLALSPTVLAQPLAQGQYFWRVRALDPAGNPSGESSVRSFHVFIGTAPANGVFSALPPTFTWAAVTGTTSYTLQIDNDTDFNNGVAIEQTQSTTSFKPASILPGTYYWRVIRAGETPVSNVYRTVFVGAAPAAPTLLAPAAGALINNSMNPPTLSWNAVTPPAGVNLTGYRLTLATNATFTTGVATFDVAGTSQVLPAQTDGVKYWKVQAVFDGTVMGTASASRSFTVDNVAPDAPTLIGPNNITALPRPTLTWTASPTATRYQVDVGTNFNLTSTVLQDYQVATTSLALTAAVLPTQLPIGQYFWRVRALDAAGNPSAESAVGSFMVFLGTGPAQNTFNVPAQPTFTWTSLPGVTTYRLEVALDGDTSFTGSVFSQAVTGLSFKLPTPQPAGIYYWRIYEEGTTAPAGYYRAFFIGATPAAPTLISPANASYVNSSTNPPTLSWNPVTPINNGGGVNYRVTVASNATFTADVYTNVTSATSLVLPPQSEGVKYWKVQALTVVWIPAGPASAVRSFTVDLTAPDTPTANLPANSATITNTRRPTFTWAAVPTATGYLLTITQQGGGAIVTDLPVTGVSYLLAAAYTLPNGTYEWTLSARDVAGNVSAASPTRTFTIALP